MNKEGVFTIQNKKGLSAIITTLLVVMLVLVAVGIVWAVVRNVVTRGVESVELGAKCLNLDIRATAVNCNIPAACNITLVRAGTEPDAITGVKLVFRDSTSSTSSAVIDVIGDVPALVGKSITNRDSTLTLPDSLEVTPYFTDASGNDQLCSTATKEF